MAIEARYICYACNSLFDEPDQYHYREDMNGEGAFEDFYPRICPVCGSEEIEELPPRFGDEEDDE